MPSTISILEEGKRLLLDRAKLIAHEEWLVFHLIQWELEGVLRVHGGGLQETRVVFTPDELEQAAEDLAALSILSDRVRLALRATT